MHQHADLTVSVLGSLVIVKLTSEQIQLHEMPFQTNGGDYQAMPHH
jgi:hypothetical protein